MSELKKEAGLRYNQGKLRYDLLHPKATQGLVEILTKGSIKYAPRNWEKGMSWTTVLASLKRHLSLIEQGQDFDTESGQLHIDHVACNAHFLSAYYSIAPQFDDRPHKYLEAKKIGLDIDEVISDFVGAIMEMEGITERPVYWNCPDLMEGYEKIKNKPEFWLNIKPKVDPKGLPFEPHCYITARSAAPEVTAQWLDTHGFPKRKIWNVGVDGSKVEAAKASGIDIFVDDRYENFVELNKAGILTYLMDAPHNQRYDVGFKRITSLKQLV